MSRSRKSVNGRIRKKGFDIVGRREPERGLFSGAEISLACVKWLAAKEGISVEQLKKNSQRMLKEKDYRYGKKRSTES
jgi:hypothetical protein